MHTHQNAGSLELMDELPGFFAVLTGDDQLGGAGAVHIQLAIFIDISIGMTSDGDGLFPGGDTGGNPFNHNRSAENRAVQQRADSAVGRQPHFRQVILLDALSVGGNGGALYAHMVFLYRFRSLCRHLVGGLFAIDEPEVVKLGVELDVRLD